MLNMLFPVAGAVLPLCPTWPSDAAYFLTDRIFTCKGNIIKVHICPSAWPKITLRTLRQVTSGLVIDTGMSRAYVEGNGNIGVLEPPLQYIPGDHLRIEFYGQCDSFDGSKHQR